MQLINTSTKQLNQTDVLEATHISNTDLNQSCWLGQYIEYPGYSSAETFSYISLTVNLKNFVQTFFSIQTGKELNEKNTSLFVQSNTGNILVFGFHNHQIKLVVNGLETTFDCTPNNVSSDAYENVLLDLYEGNYDSFIDPRLGFEALRVISPVLEQKNNLTIHKYQPGWTPNLD